MSIKIIQKNGQQNRYEFFKDGKHTHDFYNSNTGIMGSHGENVSNENKKWAGQRTNETMTRGDWTKVVKN